MSPKARTPATSPHIRQIGLVGDFLRFDIQGGRCVNFQPRNLAWLHQLLKPAIEDAAPDAQMRLMLAPTDVDAMASACANSAVFESYCQDSTQAWARLYDTPAPQAFQRLFEELLAFDLVVGFEMPPVVKRYLQAAGRTYINFYVHPLRFLRDLCLGASTNSPQIVQSLRSCAVPANETRHQAARFNGYFRRRQLERLAIPAGLPVLIGQTERDSVLIKPNGEFDSWAAHGEELRETLSGTDAVVFIEHPMRPSSAVAIQEVRATTGKAVIATNANGYGVLMSNPDIPFVVTLASSLGVEAQALGIDAHFLLADPRDKLVATGVDLNIQEPLGHGLWRSELWQDMLNNSAQTGSSEAHDCFSLGESYVRNSLESWAFRSLQNGLETQTVRKTFCASHDMAQTRQDELLAGLLGLAPVASCNPDHAIRQASTIGVHLEMLAPPLALNTEQVIRLDQPSAVGFTLLSGFHAPEPWGCWTSGLHSELLLLVSQEAVQQKCSLSVSIKFRLFDGLADKCPVLKIAADGPLPLSYAFFRPGLTQQVCTVTLPARAALVRLQLELSCIDSPAARDESADDRWLGVGLEQLKVSCHLPASEPTASKGGHQPIWGVDPSHGLVGA